jgi:hypothetical protein
MDDNPNGLKKIGAWILLVTIMYGFIKCNLKMMHGLDEFQVGKQSIKLDKVREVKN